MHSTAQLIAGFRREIIAEGIPEPLAGEITLEFARGVTREALSVNDEHLSNGLRPQK